jgi:hypothetical protein
MRIRLTAGAVAAGSLLLFSSPGWAGQAGSTFTDESVETRAIADTSSTTVGSIVIETTHDDATVIEGGGSLLDSSAVTLSLQVFEDGYHGYSPANNIAEFQAEVTNLLSEVSGTSGITTVQQAAGQANVTVSANTLVDAGDLVAQMSAFAPSGGAMSAFVLSPAFTLSNSKQAAQALAVAALGDAVANGAFASDVTAIEFVSNGSYEMSPESNLTSFAAAVLNQIDSVNTTAGITTVQQAAGQSNVQTAFTSILYGANDASVVAPLLYP